MAKEIMRRRTSENEYFHPDFHGAMSAAIEYLDQTFGENAVREYLWDFTRAYYKPLIEKIRVSGLKALKEYFEQLYQKERGAIETTLTTDELIVRVKKCPAVAHMRKRGYHVARLFHETTKTVNEALCEGTPFEAHLLDYDKKTGKCTMRFVRRNP